MCPDDLSNRLFVLLVVREVGREVDVALVLEAASEGILHARLAQRSARREKAVLTRVPARRPAE